MKEVINRPEEEGKPLKRSAAKAKQEKRDIINLNKRRKIKSALKRIQGNVQNGEPDAHLDDPSDFV